jgi:cell division protein FtsI (penicillin-binding protein 3)
VVINAPSNSVYYGNLVAGPVFKEISDKVYSTRFFKDLIAVNEKDKAQSAPDAGNGYREDINLVFRDLGIKFRRSADDDWVATKESGDTIRLVGVTPKEGQVPDVRGMTLRDAMYLLENSGLRVKFNGKGRVRKQSPEHGAKIYEGSMVSLDLNM